MQANVQDSKQWMGARMERKEDLRLVLGQGKYLADIVLPGMLHAVFVRSEYAHAKILSIDTSAARALPGVLGVYTCADLDAAGFGTLKCISPFVNRDGSPMKKPVRKVCLQV